MVEILQIDQKRGRGTEDRRRHVQDQPEQGAPTCISMRQNHGHRVKPVAQVVGNYADGNQQSQLRAGLEPDPDSYTVEKSGRTSRPRITFPVPADLALSFCTFSS